MMVKVKICGVTNVTDALAAVAAGADAIGFNFFPPSPRYIEPGKALPIRLALPPFVATVGVFVDAPEFKVREIMTACGLDYAQLHGREGVRAVAKLSDLRVIKAIRVRDEHDLTALEKYRADAFLLDAYVPGRAGGTGETFDWELARRASSRAKVILAGGLNPENVVEAIESARPYAVDVAGGVEVEPGTKSRELVDLFVRLAKGVEL
jgi:phosphoribosylanthranilate isomerase